MKGFGIEKMAALAGVMISGGFLVAIMGGPLLAAAQSGQDELNDVVNQNRTISIETTEDMASAATYVWDRAHGCSQVRPKYQTDQGYPGLAGTTYTKYPPCVDSVQAESTTGATGILGAYSLSDLPGSNFADGLFERLDGGQDMEAFHGRMYFQVEDSIELTTFKDNYANVPGDYDFYVVAITEDQSYREFTSGCSQELANPSEGTRGFLLAFDSDAGADPGERLAYMGNGRPVDGDEVDEEVGNRWLVSNDPYCNEKAIVRAYLSHGQIREYYNGNGDHAEARLCEGDRGYIQVNKNQPTEFGEAPSEYDSRGAVGLVFGSAYFPFIQITHTEGADCFNNNVQEPGSTADDPNELDSPDGSWDSEVNHRGKELHIEASSETPGKPTRIDIDHESESPSPNRGCVIRIEDTHTDEVGIVNWTANTGDDSHADSATPIFMDSGLPPELDDGYTKGYSLPDGPMEIYEELTFDGRQLEDPYGGSLLVDGDDGGHIMALWRDLLCADVQNGESDTHGQWIMCGGNQENYGGSPQKWTCYNGDKLKERWYPREKPEKDCDAIGQSAPERVNGWDMEPEC